MQRLIRSDDREWKPKLWGCKTHIADDPQCIVDLLQIQAGGESSVHKHNRLVNIFHVLSGSLVIRTWPDGADDGTRQETEIQAGEQLSVPTNVVHQFYCPHGATVLEVYHNTSHTKASVEHDIQRRSATARSAS